jgi:hypothetical protein
MWTHEKIEQFRKDYGFRVSSTKAEMLELPGILAPDEKIYGLLEGFLKHIHGRTEIGQGLVIATDHRIIFFRKGIFVGTVREEIPLSKISSASYRKGLIFCSISIVTANNDAIVEQCDKKSSEKFVNIVLDLIQNIQHINNPQLNMKHNDMTTKLEKLFELKNKGILTEEEYNQQKIKILNE